MVPILEPADAHQEENRLLLEEAGMIILGDGDGLALARTLQESPAVAGMALALASGALIVGWGAGAAPLGEWVVTPQGVELGWGWISGAVVVPYFSGAAQQPQLQAVLRRRPGMLGIGIPEDTALALGPDGQVETWGVGEVTVVVAR